MRIGSRLKPQVDQTQLLFTREERPRVEAARCAQPEKERQLVRQRASSLTTVRLRWTGRARDGAAGRRSDRSCMPPRIPQVAPGPAVRRWPARLPTPPPQSGGAGGPPVRQVGGSTWI